MIEFCNKRRMVIAILFMGAVTVFVLMFESYSTHLHDLKTLPSPSSENRTTPCWKRWSSDLIEPCRKCSSLEKRLYSYCVTGYREKVKCLAPTEIRLGVSDKFAFRSCPRPSHTEEHSFWLFEASVALIGVIGYVIVHERQQRLDRSLMDKVNKQIAAGV